ncbi:DUF6191 domain-containing protein [Streptomyces prunicolor]
MFEELFSPGRKHTQDEANRLELTRVDVADGDPGRGPIDLESGRVVVRLRGGDAEADADGESDADTDVQSDADPESDVAPASAPDPAPSPGPTSPEAPESGRPPT